MKKKIISKLFACFVRVYICVCIWNLRINKREEEKKSDKWLTCCFTYKNMHVT